MRKKFDFGKIDYTGTGRKAYAVEIEVELKEDHFERPVFSVCGSIWNTKHTDIVCGGQCLDEIANYVHTPEFVFWYDMWKKYHLNDMHPGTPEQEKALDEWMGDKRDFKYACKYLESIGLYEVEYHGLEYNGMYRYGSAWLYQPIEQDDLDRILEHLGLEKHD